jgi:ABC-type Fe3+/spermidine/putrescine transport system ATPase subunit
MRTEIRDLQRSLAITTIYVTHDQEEAMAVSDRIAVMSQGSVVQEGTAEDLYYRPASEFVATFVGRVNLVPGTLVERSGDTVTVAALGTTIRAGSAHSAVTGGAAVKLVMRPEVLELVEVGAGDFRAEVISCTFLGEKTEYLLRCGDVELQCVRHNAGAVGAIQEGSPVGVRVAASAVTVLPEAAR